MNYSSFYDRCNNYIDALLFECQVEKFNDLPKHVRQSFHCFVVKLLQDKVYRSIMNSNTKGPLDALRLTPIKNNTVYNDNVVETIEHASKRNYKMIHSTPTNIAYVTKENIDGTVEVELLPTEDQILQRRRDIGPDDLYNAPTAKELEYMLDKLRQRTNEDYVKFMPNEKKQKEDRP